MPRWFNRDARSQSPRYQPAIIRSPAAEHAGSGATKCDHILRTIINYRLAGRINSSDKRFTGGGYLLKRVFRAG